MIEKKSIILPSAQSLRKNYIELGCPDYCIPAGNESFPTPLQLLKLLRKEKSKIVELLSPDVKTQEKLILADLIALLARGKELRMVDLNGDLRQISWKRFFKEDIPNIPLEIILGIANLLKIWRESKIAIRKYKNAGKKKFELQEGSSIGYLRTNLFFGLKGGGSVSHTAGVINSFLDKGFPVHFFTSGEMPLIDKERCKIIMVPLPRVFNTFDSLRKISYGVYFRNQVAPILDKISPKILYHRLDLGSYVLKPLSDKFNAISILEFNGSEVWVEKHWGGGFSILGRALLPVLRDIELANLRSADLIITVSRVLKEDVINMGINEKKVLINPNGVEVERFDFKLTEEEKVKIKKRYKIPEDKKIITFVGTFGHWHGTAVLAKAIPHVIGKNDNLHFVFVGDGALRPDVEKIIKTNNCEKYVTITGLVPPDEIPKFLNISDILISPHVPNPDGTKFFGSPTKLFEYMASGKPIIASKLEQIGEILTDGETAILVTPGDVKELVDAILSLCDNVEKQIYLGKNARRLVEKEYTWRAHVHRIINALEG